MNMSILQLLLITLCQTTPPVITTPDNNSGNSELEIFLAILISVLFITVVILIVVTAVLASLNKRLKGEISDIETTSNLSKEHLKLISEFNKLSNEDKETALKLIQGLNSKK